jgi:hypothetical protein
MRLGKETMVEFKDGPTVVAYPGEELEAVAARAEGVTINFKCRKGEWSDLFFRCFNVDLASIYMFLIFF